MTDRIKVPGKLCADYGRGVAEVEDWYEGADVLSQLQSTFRAADYVAPKLPRVAMELVSMSQQPDVSFAQVAKVLEKDAVLCGDVLRVAGSPMYATRGRVRAISDALTRLGLGTTRDLVLQVAMQSRIFRASAYQETMEELRRHGMAVAHACRIVCRYTSLDAEYAFLCGLLHDVGKVGALIAMADSAPKNEAPALADIWHAIEDVHAEASKIMIEAWKLPPEVSMVVQAHHTIRIQGYAHPLAAAINLADQLAIQEGFGVNTNAQINARHGGLSREQVCEILNLTAAQMELISTDAKKVFSNLGV